MENIFLFFKHGILAAILAGSIEEVIGNNFCNLEGVMTS